MTPGEYIIKGISTSANRQRRQVVVIYADKNSIKRSVTRHLRNQSGEWVGRKWNPDAIAIEYQLVKAWQKYESLERQLDLLSVKLRKAKHPAVKAALVLDIAALEIEIAEARPERKPNFYEPYTSIDQQQTLRSAA